MCESVRQKLGHTKIQVKRFVSSFFQNLFELFSTHNPTDAKTQLLNLIKIQRLGNTTDQHLAPDRYMKVMRMGIKLILGMIWLISAN